MFTVSKRPLVVDLGARSTKALGLGLFGFGSDREIRLEGSVACGVTRKLWIGAEFKEQIDARTWSDIAFRYVVSDDLNLDAGIANLASGLSNQLALGATYRF